MSGPAQIYENYLSSIGTYALCRDLKQLYTFETLQFH